MQYKEIKVTADTMVFWHGGNIDKFIENQEVKKGNYEYGPGLYMITDYMVANKYAKGTRKLFLIYLKKGVDLKTKKIPVSDCLNFLEENFSSKIFKEYSTQISQKYTDYIKGDIFLNILINNELLKSKQTLALQQFFLSQGIDYYIITNVFGSNNVMLVLFNFKKINQIYRVLPGDRFVEYDLTKIPNNTFV